MTSRHSPDTELAPVTPKGEYPGILAGELAGAERPGLKPEAKSLVREARSQATGEVHGNPEDNALPPEDTVVRQVVGSQATGEVYGKLEVLLEDTDTMEVAAPTGEAVEVEVAGTTREPGAPQVTVDGFTTDSESTQQLERTVLTEAVKAFRLASNTGRDTLVVRLDPPELGSISLRLVSTDAGLTARFVASEPAARFLLAGQLGELAESLTQHGLTMEGAGVFSGDASDTPHQQSWSNPRPFRPPFVPEEEPEEELLAGSAAALDLQV